MQQIWVLISYTKRSSDMSCTSNGIQTYSYNYRSQSNTNSTYFNYLFKTLNLNWNQLKGVCDKLDMAMQSFEPLHRALLPEVVALPGFLVTPALPKTPNPLHPSQLRLSSPSLSPSLSAPHLSEVRAQALGRSAPWVMSANPLLQYPLGLDA